MSKSTRKDRLQKPREDFPLFPHDPTHPERARWAKKIRGHLHYFGKVLPDDPKGEKALQLWLDQKDELLAGRKPRPKCDGLTVEDLVNKWLHAKRQRVDSRELGLRTWQQYKALGAIVADSLGRNRLASDVQPDDFAKLRTVFSNRWGVAKLDTAVKHTRGIWRWAYQDGLITTPQRFGDGFSKPSAKTMRQARNARGPRMFEPEQVLAILDVADVNTKAMVLLGLQGGIGNTDLALLPVAALDLQAGWLTLPRAKTGIGRRIPLWRETISAIREVLQHRPEPKRGNEDLLFLTARGGNYVSNRDGTAIGETFQSAAKQAGVTGRTFYDLRRTFQTVADGAKDPVATSAIMGHAASGQDMSAVYRQRVDDDRLRAVVDVVHDWLFGAGGDGSGKDGRKVTRQDAKQAPAPAAGATPIQLAIVRCLQAIASAEGQDKAVLRSAWNESEIALALSGESWTVERFLRQWGDDRSQDDRPRLRLVGG